MASHPGTNPSVASNKPRMVLHIGMHKTGSSSLQRYLARNRPVLRLFGIDYPVATGPRGQKLSKHNDLFLAISHEKDKRQPHPVLGPSSERIARITSAMKPGRTTILSAEGFSGESPAFAKVFQPLTETADVRVVCFLRPQDQWVVSFYKQMVLSREVRMRKPFEEFLSMRGTRRHLDYANMLRWWSDAIGRENIRILIYPPTESVVADFLNAAGLPSWLARLPWSRSWQNKGQPTGYVERVRMANIQGTEKPMPAANDHDSPILSASQRAELMAAHAEGNEWIRATFRPDLASLFPT